MRRKFKSLKKLWYLAGGNIYYFSKIIFIDFLFKFLKINNHFYLKLRKFNKFFPIFVTNRSDLLTLKEIFLHDEYGLNLPSRASIIFDLGANVGYASIYFALKYPNAKIFSYEPDPKNFQILKENIRNFPNVSAHQVAVGGKDGNKLFFSSGKSGASSSFTKRGNEDEAISVFVKTLGTLIKELSIREISILKFDVEGAEEIIFMDKNFSANKIVHMVGEVHGDLISCSLEDFCFNLSKSFYITKKRVSKNRIIVSGKSLEID